MAAVDHRFRARPDTTNVDHVAYEWTRESGFDKSHDDFQAVCSACKQGDPYGGLAVIFEHSRDGGATWAEFQRYSVSDWSPGWHMAEGIGGNVTRNAIKVNKHMKRVARINKGRMADVIANRHANDLLRAYDSYRFFKDEPKALAEAKRLENVAAENIKALGLGPESEAQCLQKLANQRTEFERKLQ